MPAVDVVVECPVAKSFRVEQMRGMFDVPAAVKSRREFHAELPDLDGDWTLGAIVGPSGSGKTQLARHVFGRRLQGRRRWPAGRSILDAFPESATIQAITGTLTAVGFSSPPAWLRPYGCLSNGEQFRSDLARALLTGGKLVVFDEFTSVVDRTVAKIASAAVAKAVRKQRVPCERFVAVSCHRDILEWLCPDWVLDTATGELTDTRRRLRRPPIRLSIFRCAHAAWPLFAPHHYLTARLHRSAQCHLVCWGDREVAFVGILSAAGRIRRKRISRIVVLPDFQGVGIGRASAAAVADLYRRQGITIAITTGHAAMIRALRSSPAWHLIDFSPQGERHFGSLKAGKDCAVAASMGSLGRCVARFQYVGTASGAQGSPGSPRRSPRRPSRPGTRRRRPTR